MVPCSRILLGSLAALGCACSPAPTPVTTVVQDEPVIGPGGGVVIGQGSIQGTSLNIPAGALTQETPIELGADPDPPAIPYGYVSAGPAVLCSPEGLTFNFPATLLIPYQGLGDIELFTASGEDGQVWQYFDGGSPNDNTHLFRAAITHFSRYQPFRVVIEYAPDGGELLPDGGGQ